MSVNAEMQTALDLIGRSYHRVIPPERRSEFFWQREKQHVLTLLAKEPKLAATDPDSFARAIANAAAMGLSLNPAMGHCYLIPRKARKRGQGESWADYNANVPSLVYAVPSYMGLADLAVRSERVIQIVAEVVFEADTFRYHGPMKMPTHEVSHRSADRTYEKAAGVYACARLPQRRGSPPEGLFQATYIDRETVLRIRALSEAPDSLMWSEQGMWTEGWKKAAVRRLWKLLPKSPALVEAFAAMDLAEGPVEPEREVKVEQAVVLVSDADVAELVGQMTSAGLNEKQVHEWSDRLALRFQVASLAELEKGSLAQARKVLAEALAELAERRRKAKEGGKPAQDAAKG